MGFRLGLVTFVAWVILAFRLQVVRIFGGDWTAEEWAGLILYCVTVALISSMVTAVVARSVRVALSALAQQIDGGVVIGYLFLYFVVPAGMCMIAGAVCGGTRRGMGEGKGCLMGMVIGLITAGVNVGWVILTTINWGGESWVRGTYKWVPLVTALFAMIVTGYFCNRLEDR